MARKFSVETTIQAKDKASPVIANAVRSVRLLTYVTRQLSQGNVDAIPLIQRLVAGIGSLRVALGVGLLGGAVAVTAALGALFSKIGDGIKAFSESERAISKLEAALRSTGSFTREASNDIQAYADALQAGTTATQSQVLELVALAKGFGATNEQAKDLASATLDFAQGAQLNVTEAARRLGRALQGSAADVANFAPEIRQLTAEQLRLGGATDLIAEKFRGQAAAALGTYQGALENLANAQRRLEEVQGALFVDSAALTESISLQARLTDRLSGATEKSRISFDRLAIGWQNLKLLGTGLQLKLVEAGDAVVDISSKVNAALRSWLGFKVAVEAVTDSTAGARDAFRRTVAESEDLTQNLATLTSVLGDEAAALDVLFRAHERELQLIQDHAAAAEVLSLTLQKLGLRTLDQVERALVEATAAQGRIEQAWRNGEIGAATYTSALEKLGLEQEALRAVLDGTAESTDAYKQEVLETRAEQELARRATDQMAKSTDGLRRSNEAGTIALRAQREEVRLTVAEFDALARSQGRAAATTAALKQGAVLEQGGTRVSFGGPGRGSRLVDSTLGNRGGLFPGISGAVYTVNVTEDEITQALRRTGRI